MPAAISAPPPPREFGQDEAEEYGGEKIADYVIYLVRQDDGRVFGGLLTREQITTQEFDPVIAEVLTSRRQGAAFFG